MISGNKYLTSLGLSFPNCNMGITPAPLTSWEAKGDDAFERDLAGNFKLYKLKEQPINLDLNELPLFASVSHSFVSNYLRPYGL